MKNGLLSCAFIFLTINISFSQGIWTTGPMVSLGVSGNQSEIFELHPNTGFGEASYSQKTKILPSFGAGWWLKFQTNKRLGMSLGLQYNLIQHFGQNENTFINAANTTRTFSQVKTTTQAHQLQAPLQIQFYFGKKDHIRPYLSFGENFSYNLSMKEFSKNMSSFSGEITHSSSERDVNFDYNRSFKRFDIQLMYGFGVDFGAFSIEVNRIQNLLKEPNYTYFDICCFGTCPPAPTSRTIHSTTLSIRYRI